MQVAILLAKADTYVARIDMKPKTEQKKLAEKALLTLDKVYKETNNPKIKKDIKISLRDSDVSTKTGAIHKQKKVITKQKERLVREQKQLQVLRNAKMPYVAPDPVNDTFMALDEIMNTITTNCDDILGLKVEQYLERKYNENA